MSESTALLESMLQAFEEAIATMTGLEFTVEQVEAVRTIRLDGEIAATIGLAGENDGLMLLAMARALAGRAIGSMLQLEAALLSPAELEDGVGEIANVIAGGARRRLFDTAFAFELSLPSVISGSAEIRPCVRGLPAGMLIRARAGGADMRLAIWLAARGGSGAPAQRA